MTDSPASPTPYEILGVAASASQAELRRAYRRLLRESHPDTGGNPARFDAVQQAWKRIGETGAREVWDLGDHSRDSSPSAPARPAGPRQEGSSVRARSYGHPGGQARERYLTLVREWAGRGAELPDPYDPALVRSAPREIRHQLANALAEEATARAVSGLGIGYTIWNGVRAKTGRIDHIVLGPAGLFAIMSEDWGSEVRMVRGELKADGIVPPDQPARTLSRTARA
ncbi:MAG: DnaJ domain-containing protein, partial [Terrimesophilobacter sp.]